MENKTRGTGKSKKIVIGVATIVAVAAIAVPTALTLTGGNNGNAGASGNESNKYSIIVSTGLSNAPDYNLSIEKGTTISELKTLLKAIDGYTITGIYKDEAMNHPYSDNETISSSTKIYIKFVAITYTVNIYAEDGTTLLETQEVNHKDSLSLVAPTKAEDNFATYEFKGWYNERNELVNLNEITSDLNIHPEYRTIMKEYKIGYIGGEFKDSISVTIGGEVVDLSSTYHYGAKIVIRATQKVGRDITEFKVKVGTGETQDILTETHRHEENGVVYYEYELDGNGDLSITYNEAASEYSIGTIPEEVSVIRNGHSLSSNETIYYGDELVITYKLWEDCTLNEFSVTGAEFIHGTENTYKVMGNTEIVYDYTYAYSYLSFKDWNDGVEVTGFDGSVTDVTIPGTYKGKKVIRLKGGSLLMKEGLFKNSNITSIIISDGVSEIVGYTFYGCEDLVSVSLPNTLNIIGRYAFSGCKNVVSLSLPNSITEISVHAFSGCQSLESISIPNNLTYISVGSFSECSRLSEVKIPTSITSIEGSVFKNCISLKNINIPSGVDYLGDNVFYGCTSLESAIIPKNISDVRANLFYGCSSLTDVIIPNNITAIREGAFGECTSLASITIPSSVSIIDATAFEGCTKLATVTINSLTIYSGINGNDSNPLSGLIKYATKIRVPKSHLDITQNAYLSGENFASYDDGEYYVYVPASEFSYLTFTDCEGGCEVSSFDGSVTQVIIPALFRGKKVMGIKASTKGPTEAVFGNSNITSVKISEGVEYIGDCAFYGCQKLSSVNLGSVKTINSSAFGSCTKLYGINIPNSVETLSTSVFSGCTNLMQVTLSENIKSIGIYCFANTNIQTFTINGQYVYSVTKSDLFRVGGSENYPKTIKVLKTADNGSNSFINQNYTKTDSGNYWVYTLN